MSTRLDSREAERQNPPYSHRNGETTAPEVKGWYFTYNTYGFYIPPSVYVHFFNGKEWDNPAAMLFKKNTRYYGPIREPKWSDAPSDNSDL